MNVLPLHGITVIEMGSSVAGPFACRILADLGAEVIKVEPPMGGEASRGWGVEQLGGTSPTYQALNFGKRSIAVDFKDADDLAALKRLIRDRADVLVQNLRPGVADRLGLGPDDAAALNERLVYCNISAFGRTGPMSQMPGYDPLLQAFGGIIDVTGPADGPPARVGVPIMDKGTGLWTVIGVLGALQLRARTGKGCVVDTAMMDVAMAWQSISAAIVEAGGEAQKRSGLKGPLLVPNTGYQTSDGILLVTIGTDRQFRKFCDAVGCGVLPDDPRFVDNSSRTANEPELREELEKTLRHKTRAQWSSLLNSVDVPNAPIQSVKELIDHEQTEASDILQTPPGATFKVVSNVLKFDGQRPGPRSVAPELGEANNEILSKYRP